VNLPAGPLWRVWLVIDGALVAPFARLGADPRGREPWPAGRAEAVCLDGRADDTPGKRCECGIRGMERLADVLAVMRSVGHLPNGRPCAVGKVELSGKVIGPSRADPRHTWRGRFAELSGPLYVTTNTPHEARAALSSTYRRPVLSWSELPQDEVNGPYSWKPLPPTFGPRKVRARAGRR
jgi:hypothetical protein